MLGPIFLKCPVASIFIRDITYTPSLEGSSAGISEVVLGQVDYSNPSDATQNLPWSFTGTVTRPISTILQQSLSTVYGSSISIEVSAEPFDIGGRVAGGRQWQAITNVQTSATTSSERLLFWAASGELAPGHGTKVSAICYQGNGQTENTSRVTLKLKDGTTSTFTEQGTLRNVIYTEVRVLAESYVLNGLARRLVINDSPTRNSTPYTCEPGMSPT
ncbi:hypothetical protein OBBRIDRAFT_784610 [Obba rivulosa]|uniref:Uncharacterized protein n=1 Tax=Obba rivulosa TaxID=1052685 RepID=A0A8E2DH86_9APHY|nr:hypothetical protein OBBRIDRAFT_784610 [Obba rivulosa]